MKNTILSQKDSQLIEAILTKHGRIVTVEDLMKIFTKSYSQESAHNRIQFLYKSGWFLRLKRGLYLIVDSVSSRSIGDLSLLLISQAFNKNSYISLDSALNYYQMFDQYTNKITAINCDYSKKYLFQNNTFQFVKVVKKYYFGFVQVRQDGKLINMATKEKALLDYLYLDNSFYSANLVFEKLKEHQSEIDFEKLQEYAIKYNITLQRKIGFLLDALKIDSSKILKNLKSQIGYSRFTKESKIFNAKWRLYYDDRIIN